MVAVALLLAGCSSARSADVTARADAAVASAPAPELSAAEVVAAIGTGTRNGLPDTVDLWETYLALMALGDATCPADPLQLIDANVPLSGCTAASGVTYAGVSVVMTEEELGGGPDTTARLVGGDFTITDAAGHTFDFGGQVSWSGSASDGKVSVEARVSGTFAYPAGSPWLAAGASAVLEELVEDDGGARFVLDGGLGTEGVDLWFDALTWAAEGDHAPSGAIRVRDPSGAWWTYTLDSGGACGALAYPGRADEDVCVDLASIYRDAVPMLETWP